MYQDEAQKPLDASDLTDAQCREEVQRMRKLLKEKFSPLQEMADIPITSPFRDVPMGPPDAILGIKEAFDKDTYDGKVNLSVGAYRDNDGKPVVLPSIRQAEKIILDQEKNHEYAPIAGLAEFVEVSLKFAYGADAEVLASKRVAGLQSLSGTGSLRVVGEFYAKMFGTATRVYVPNPTWGNHIAIFKNCGLDVRKYRYYHPQTRGLDLEGMLQDIWDAEPGSVFLLHACAHNPTGVDPSQEQWKMISRLLLNKRHKVFFDSAYQGFASGDSEQDAWAIREFIRDGHFISLAQSFAKNFGLYGERIGCVSLVCSDEAEASRVLSQLKLAARAQYSNPPLYGARIVHTILSDPSLHAQWALECQGMARRIIEMRQLLRATLESKEEGAGASSSWAHITEQIGMFCYTGLSGDQVKRLAEEFHIYFPVNGRISICGVNTNNVQYIADAFHAVTAQSSSKL
eukprot:CAMPEP_0113938202 /NCGR_PEP_ID=MMETSP1339-20121228/4610_1 /TAXON_ID=94617 /ORGANISM="Fibrocapsa japonica" /LENGTH=457 /DNA_ID=CAMNT_0000941195 /DNA_START=55 /DNA_END=1428 /DNA_ORIENTATION=- /assembly_acc=CAM_ASM_000762